MTGLCFTCRCAMPGRFGEVVAHESTDECVSALAAVVDQLTEAMLQLTQSVTAREVREACAKIAEAYGRKHEYKARDTDDLGMKHIHEAAARAGIQIARLILEGDQTT